MNKTIIVIIAILMLAPSINADGNTKQEIFNSLKIDGEADAAEALGAWLKENGVAREKIFMAWEGYPKLSELNLKNQ